MFFVAILFLCAGRLLIKHLYDLYKNLILNAFLFFPFVYLIFDCFTQELRHQRLHHQRFSSTLA